MMDNYSAKNLRFYHFPCAVPSVLLVYMLFKSLKVAEFSNLI